MLTNDARRGTTGDFARGKGDELLDLAAADRAPLFTVGGNGHAGPEMTGRRPVGADDGRDRYASATVERSKRCREQV